MKVAIVGLGIAGLRAAMLLERAGVEVELFEARDRIGGRLYTTPEGFEAGGEWIDADHYRCINLLGELGMVAEPCEDDRYVVLYKADTATSDRMWEPAKKDMDAVLTAAQRLSRRLDPVPWNNLATAKHDSVSLSSFLDKHCDSEIGRWWCEAQFRSDEGDDTDRISLLGWLCGRSLYDGDSRKASAYRIPGGAGAILGEVQSSLRAKPVLNAVLRKVTRAKSGVILDFDAFQMKAGAVVLTLPPPCLRKVEFSPELPAEKFLALSNCRMGRAIKVCMQFSSRFWESEGHTGNLFTDSSLQQVWSESADREPMLNAYICGEDSLRVLASPDPLHFALDLLAKHYPLAREHFVRGSVFDWIHDPHSLGGFSHIQPGYAIGSMQYIATPVDGIHFAGEHTALWTGFIEGALESAERAVREILSPHYAVALLD
jgi:monoamine oxidase